MSSDSCQHQSLYRKCARGKNSSAARWGCYIENIDVDGNIAHVASLWGPVVTDHDSRWFMGSPHSTNQTGELNNVSVDDDGAAFVYDSMHVTNQTQEKWKPKANKEATKLNEECTLCA
jgi:hypothetical protein